MLRTSCKSDSPPSINEAPHSNCTFLQRKRTLLHLRTAEVGTFCPLQHCRDSVCYLRCFCRLSHAGGMPLHYPSETFSCPQSSPALRRWPHASGDWLAGMKASANNVGFTATTSLLCLSKQRW